MCIFMQEIDPTSHFSALYASGIMKQILELLDTKYLERFLKGYT